MVCNEHEAGALQPHGLLDTTSPRVQQRSVMYNCTQLLSKTDAECDWTSVQGNDLWCKLVVASGSPNRAGSRIHELGDAKQCALLFQALPAGIPAIAVPVSKNGRPHCKSQATTHNNDRLVLPRLVQGRAYAFQAFVCLDVGAMGDIGGIPRTIAEQWQLVLHANAGERSLVSEHCAL